MVNDFEMDLKCIWINPEKPSHFDKELERRGIVFINLQDNRDMKSSCLVETFKKNKELFYGGCIKTNLNPV